MGIKVGGTNDICVVNWDHHECSECLFYFAFSDLFFFWLKGCSVGCGVWSDDYQVVHNPDHVRGVVKGMMSFAVGPHWRQKYASSKPKTEK